MNIIKIKSDLDKLILRAEEVNNRNFARHVKKPAEIGIRVSALTYLRNLLGEDHEYYLQFKEHSISGKYLRIDIGIEILRALRRDIDESWFFDLKQLIAAELFVDFLEMADHLIFKGYKDAAAVMIGSTLESHLKQLCLKYKIEITFVDAKGVQKPKKAGILNAELQKAEVYNSYMQKNVTAWLDLRNRAAHGDYSKYDIDHVQLMYDGVFSFISKTTK